MACQKRHHTIPAHIADLPESQKTAFRHVCAACAYEEGLSHGYAKARRLYEERTRRALKWAQAHILEGADIDTNPHADTNASDELDARDARDVRDVRRPRRLLASSSNT